MIALLFRSEPQSLQSVSCARVSLCKDLDLSDLGVLRSHHGHFRPMPLAFSAMLDARSDPAPCPGIAVVSYSSGDKAPIDDQSWRSNPRLVGPLDPVQFELWGRKGEQVACSVK